MGRLNSVCIFQHPSEALFVSITRLNCARKKGCQRTSALNSDLWCVESDMATRPGGLQKGTSREQAMRTRGPMG